jgi:hypothetical protein
MIFLNIFDFWCYATFSYIMATSFSGGRSRREPPTMGKQLVNFITCGSEWSASFFVIYKAKWRNTKNQKYLKKSFTTR